MSKELTPLEQFYYIIEIIRHHSPYPNCINKYIENVENMLKALEIIKETRADTNIIKESGNYDDYCGLEAQKMLALMFSAPKQKGITEEEYDLLKEILK